MSRCPKTVQGREWGGGPWQCVYKEGHVERGRQIGHGYATPGPDIHGRLFIDDEKLRDDELRN